MSTTTTTVVRRNRVNSPNTQTNRRRRLRQNVKKNKPQAGKSQPFINLKKADISPCTKSYTRALVNPFGSFDELPCIPDAITLPSYKFMTSSRGVFSTGTLGNGFIAVSPWEMVHNGTVVAAPDIYAPVIATGVTYSSANYVPLTGGALTTGVFAAASNSMMNPTDWLFTTQRQFRVVGCGLKIQYVGSSFHNQGTILLARSMGNQTFTSGVTQTELLADNQNILIPISRREEYVFYVPDSPDLLGYYPLTEYYNGRSERRSLMIYISGCDIDTPQSWTFEVITYFEAIGPGFTYSASHFDPIGGGSVLAALPTRLTQSTPQFVENTVLRGIWKNISDNITLPSMMSVGGKLANYAVNAAMSNSQIASQMTRALTYN